MRRRGAKAFPQRDDQVPELEMRVLGSQRKKGGRCSVAGGSPLVRLQRVGSIPAAQEEFAFRVLRWGWGLPVVAPTLRNGLLTRAKERGQWGEGAMLLGPSFSPTGDLVRIVTCTCSLYSLL